MDEGAERLLLSIYDIPADLSYPQCGPATTRDGVRQDETVAELLGRTLPLDFRNHLNVAQAGRATNGGIVSLLGAERGEDYLQATGRVDGYTVTCHTGDFYAPQPEFIRDTVELYKTVDGARLAFDQYLWCLEARSALTLIEPAFPLGDAHRACAGKVLQSGGVYFAVYRVEFLYRNVIHGVEAWDLAERLHPEVVDELALTLLAKLEQAQLLAEISVVP